MVASMWRDPLDELIDDLARAAPDPQGASGNLFPFEQLTRLTDAILCGSPEEVEMLMADPAYQEWIRQSRAARSKAERPVVSGLAERDRR